MAVDITAADTCKFDGSNPSNRIAIIAKLVKALDLKSSNLVMTAATRISSYLPVVNFMRLLERLHASCDEVQYTAPTRRTRFGFGDY